MSDRKRFLKSIAETISDYRFGVVVAPTPKHVEKWIEQFDEEVQEPILKEMDYVLEKTYLNKHNVQEFLSALVKNKKLTSNDPVSFWKGVDFLDIQGGGNSQRDMLRMFSEVLGNECGFEIDDCGGASGAFIYLDDGIYTGNRIKNDITSWIQSDAPKEAKVYVITIALHSGGQFYAKKGIEKAALDAGKKIEVFWWRCVEIEDRNTYVNMSGVLRPTSLPADEGVQAYVRSMKYAQTLRRPGSVGKNKFFSSEEGRNLLEQEFLRAGVYIRSVCPNLNVYQRPLGNMVLDTLGFGSLLVTFRNCPNNCPLALWAGDPWYPLFPRNTN